MSPVNALMELAFLVEHRERNMCATSRFSRKWKQKTTLVARIRKRQFEFLGHIIRRESLRNLTLARRGRTRETS